MSWMNIEIARRIAAELEASGASVRTEVHPEDSRNDPAARARVTLTLKDPAHGNILCKEASESTIAADFLAAAKAELEQRAKDTRRRIAAERRFS